MKLSVAVAPDNAPPSAFVVFRGIEASIQKAAALGYHGIELAIAGDEDVRDLPLDRWLAATNMEVAAVSTGLVYAAKGLSLLEAPDETAKVFKGLIDVAAHYGKKVNIGRSRGLRGQRTVEQAADALRDTLAPLCEYAGHRGVELMLEPVNRYEVDWVNSVADGAAVLARMGLPGVGLMPDVFHMNIEDAHIGQALTDHAPHVRYVHLADSNRLAPGSGHLDFDEVFGALAAIGYDGWASVEILPKPDPETAARQAAEFLLPRMGNS